MRRVQTTKAGAGALKKHKSFLKESQKRRKYFSNYLNKLNNSYINGKISYATFVETVYKKRDGKNILEWRDYYGKLEKKFTKSLINKKNFNVFLIFFISLFLIFSLFVLQSQFNITGFVTQDFFQDITQHF